MFKRILVTLDGSSLAESVLPYVRYIAFGFRSEVEVVGVISEAERGLGFERVFEGYLAKIASDLKAENVKARPVLLSGNPSEAIIKYEAERHADLIAMTMIGKGGFSRWKIGSVAAKVVAAADAPVLMVPVRRNSKPASEPFFTRILMPVDVSELGGAALPCVRSLTGKNRASVILLNVESEPYTPTSLSQEYYKETSEFLRKTTRIYLAKTAATIQQTGADVIWDIVSGDPADTILKYARTKKCDLIAISTHGRTGIVRWALGSVANKVLHQTEMPLLLVRSPAAVCPVAEEE